MQWPGVEGKKWPSCRVVRLSHGLHQWPCWWTQLAVGRPSTEKEGSSFERKSFHWPFLPPDQQLGCGVKADKYTHVQAYMYTMYMSSLFNSLGAYLTRGVNFKSLGVVDSNGVPWCICNHLPMSIGFGKSGWVNVDICWFLIKIECNALVIFCLRHTCLMGFYTQPIGLLNHI